MSAQDEFVKLRWQAEALAIAREVNLHWTRVQQVVGESEANPMPVL